MWFNGLEQSLDNVICQIFTDRSDSTSLINDLFFKSGFTQTLF
jgi:hypothetical protein